MAMTSIKTPNAATAMRPMSPAVSGSFGAVEGPGVGGGGVGVIGRGVGGGGVGETGRGVGGRGVGTQQLNGDCLEMHPAGGLTIGSMAQ